MQKASHDFNACEDFFVLITISHILTAALSVLGMNSLKDTPSTNVLPQPQNVWMETKAKRKEILMNVCTYIVDTFANFSFHGVPTTGVPDNVSEYSKQLLHLGCFYREYSDAIREGDGNRILRCWRYLLPIFLGSGRTNYSCEVLNMLFQHTYALSPRLSFQLLWSRCINVHGRQGKNIPADLHMEHLNRLVKDAVKNLGANKTEKAISRVGRALGTIAPVLSKFDEENFLTTPSGMHKIGSYERDATVVVKELSQVNVFTTVSERKHPSFPRPRNVLHAKTKQDVVSWMTKRLHSQHRI